jgi:predicted GTPase
MARKRILIMGAAGRDFHNFNTIYRRDRRSEVVAFTAAQIPNIDGRRYPASLAGPLYPRGIPIHPEAELARLIPRREVDEVVFSYSDLPFASVMEKAAVVNAAGAHFTLLSAESTMLASKVPVIAVLAVRTGCGKSQISRATCTYLRERGLRVVAVRHPMPYGKLAKQKLQRFASLDDLVRHDCTVEEMEEYEPHIVEGGVIYAGVDYETILREAEREADVILWDGGNNDTSFYRPDLTITIADPHRPGHEASYYPGATNVRLADVVIINKVDSAARDSVDRVGATVREMNPKARVLEAESAIHVDAPEAIRDKRVLVIEDGPTLTHGEMKYGAGTLAAQRHGAREIVDPRPYAVRTIAETFERYPNTGALLPAMGYGEKQLRDLQETIRRTPVDCVIVGTPIDLSRIIRIEQPTARVEYGVAEASLPALREVLDAFFAKNKIRPGGSARRTPNARRTTRRKK